MTSDRRLQRNTNHGTAPDKDRGIESRISERTITREKFLQATGLGAAFMGLFAGSSVAAFGTPRNENGPNRSSETGDGADSKTDKSLSSIAYLGHSLSQDSLMLRLNLAPDVNSSEPWSSLYQCVAQVIDKKILDTNLVFGVSAERLLELDASVASRMIKPDFDYAPCKFTVQGLASKIKTEVYEILSAETISPSSALGQRILASGISSWMRTHVTFNETLGNDITLQKTKALYWTSSTMMQQPILYAVCAGYSRLTKDLSDYLGLNSVLILGVVGGGDRIPSRWTHSWNSFSFLCPDGSMVSGYQCDNTMSRIYLEDARALNGNIHNPQSLPVFPADWGYCLWRQRAMALDRNKPLTADCTVDRLSENQWRQIVRRGPRVLIPLVESKMSRATVNITL